MARDIASEEGKVSQWVAQSIVQPRSVHTRRSDELRAYATSTAERFPDIVPFWGLSNALLVIERSLGTETKLNGIKYVLYMY